ncbi:MAG: hypothetical protein QM817_15940 [Archangium sp.]
MLIVMGVLLVATTAAVATLTMIGREAELQGANRRDVEAFFAAEAGLAEGRERLRLLAERTPNFTTYTSIMATLPPVTGIGAAGETWYEVLPATSYPLTTSGTELALDPNITTAGRELRDSTGARFSDFPTGATVRYRVFLRDDADESTPVATADSNGQVWLVAMGEVVVSGGAPVRRVTQALVTYRAGSERIDCAGQKGGCADKTNAGALDARTPTVSGVNVL